MRAATLIASATEIVCALGCREQLVGRSHECDFPPDVRDLPALTEPKFPTDGTSYDVDQRVKAIVQEGASVYRVFADKLAELDVDLIVTQDQCEVCAASLSDVEAALCDWTGRPMRIVSLKPDALADIWGDIRKVAGALGIQEQGERLVSDLRGRMRQVSERATQQPQRPRVACIEWVDPLMAAGNWMPELVEMAGGENLFGAAGEHAPWITWEELAQADPDVIVVLPCGYDIARSLQDMPILEAKPGWRDLRAVREGRVAVADGNQYFNRPGPRVAEGLEIMAEILHPDAFDFGHAGRGWVRHQGSAA
jgi:iron complex transport system substrate-binding protein